MKDSRKFTAPIELGHRGRLDIIHDVYVGFHGRIVAVACPFHNNVSCPEKS